MTSNQYLYSLTFYNKTNSNIDHILTGMDVVLYMMHHLLNYPKIDSDLKISFGPLIEILLLIVSSICSNCYYYYNYLKFYLYISFFFFFFFFSTKIVCNLVHDELPLIHMDGRCNYIPYYNIV